MSKFRKEVILDFDYTLFDTARFKTALSRALRIFKVPPSLFVSTYASAIHKFHGQYRYSPAAHLKLIQKKVPSLSIVRARRCLGAVVKDSARYLYPGARKFLNNLTQAGFRLILVTRGHKHFQRQKLTHSGIGSFFTKVVISPALKISTMASLARRFDEVFFVSDHAGELKQVQRLFPRLLPVMKLGSHHGSAGEARRLKIPAFNSLNKIETYIINYYNHQHQ